MRTRQLMLGFAIVCALTGGTGAAAVPQQTCRAPEPTPSREPNIFTAAQESDLGDAVAERLEPQINVITDEALTAPLRRVGERLVRHLPATDLNIRFALMELPSANAYVLPGGRIYVSRKLVGFVRTEDELAGVLGHELGHLVLRQQTLDMTRRLREVLNVTAVGDRKDIIDKYNRLMDNAARKPEAFRSATHGERDQIEADRIGLFVVAAAGYDPKAHVTLFDRLAETEGNTGNFLSRMLGTTSPDSKRLGELIKTAATLPAGCAESRAAAEAAAFQTWQSAVVSFSGLSRKESLHKVVARTTLTPPLRGEIRHLRFSPDGRYVMAQDDGGVYVMSKDPFALLFRIDAPEAEAAQFTPDSREIVFHTHALRIERWRVTERKLVEARDLVRRRDCFETALSADGRVLGCLDSGGDLWLIDVATSETIFQKKEFYRQLAWGAFLHSRGVQVAPMKFSPDARFFAAGYQDPQETVGFLYDLQARAVVPLKPLAKRLVADEFTFTGSDRLIGHNWIEPAKSGVLLLPSGELGEQFHLSRGDLAAPTAGNFLLIRPFQKYAVGLMDLASKNIVKGNAMAAFDTHGATFVAERGTGDIGLYAMEGNRFMSAVTLPPGNLARVYAVAVSTDLSWLAVSERSRGALWNVSRGERISQVRGFRGAFFDDGGHVFADLPRSGADPRAIMRLDPIQRVVTNGGEIKDQYVSQFGQWLLVTRPLPPNTLSPTGMEVEVRDVRRPAPLWKRTYPKDPPEVWVHAGSDTVVFSWVADSPAGREVIRKDPGLRTSVKLGDIEGDYILEIANANTGAARRTMLLETGKGSFSIREMFTVGDWLAVTDSIGRVLVYSLTTGELKGHAFGMEPAINPAAGLLAVDAGAGRLVVYDLETMARRDEFRFAHEIPLKTFSADGKRLFVLTSDQTAFVLDVSR